MTKKRTSLAKKKPYCVWADYVRRVYQHVEAKSPKDAFMIAKDNVEAWDFCYELPEPDCYRLSNEVQDLATEEFTAIHGSTHCKTCDSEIVETVNDSNFREGECGSCEYDRYVSHPKLLITASAAYGAICDLSYHPCFRWNKRRFREANKASDELASVLNLYGKEE